jgi:DNA-binding transcriptional ArsR family regulator
MSEPVPADVLRAIAHPMRLALLVALEDHDQTPAELAMALNASEPAIAQHLAILHDARLVTDAAEPGRLRTVDGWSEIATALGRLQDG